jgi:hypothetical protein
MIHPARILLMAALGLTISAIGAPGANWTPTPAPPSYTLTEIAPGKNFIGLYMNSFGEIVGSIPNSLPGSMPGSFHAAIYVHGNIIDLGAQLNPAIESVASFVNLQGEVLVTSFTETAEGDFFAGYTYKNGRFTLVQFPTGASMNSFAGLNDFGCAVGNFIDPTNTNGSLVSGFLLEPDGAFVKLPIVTVGNSCINDVGQILGENRMVGVRCAYSPGTRRSPNSPTFSPRRRYKPTRACVPYGRFLH